MNALLAALLTSVPVALGAWRGWHIGGRRSVRLAAAALSAWALAAVLTYGGWRAGWVRPFGLITPVVVALLATTLTGLLLRRRSAAAQSRRIRTGSGAVDADLSPVELAPPRTADLRWVGGTLGGLGGLAIAWLLWSAAMLAIVPLPPALSGSERLASNMPADQNLSTGASDSQGAEPAPGSSAPESNPESDGESAPASDTESAGPSKRSWFSGVVTTANRGFIQHVPIAGRLSRELEAVATILQTPASVRRAYADQQQWASISELPTMKAIAENEPLMAEIDRLAAGNLASLYRLQKDPHIIAFFQEPQVQQLLPTLSAVEMARELASTTPSPKQ